MTNNFEKACLNGDNNLVKVLYCSGTVDIHHRNSRIFRWVCEKGKLEVAKFLYSLGEFKDCFQEAFEGACNYCYFNVAEWLNSVGEIDIGDAFRFVCRLGSFESVKWLYEKGNVEIWEGGFREACESGLLTVAKWIYNKGKIDIRAHDHWAIKEACYHRDEEIVDWLMKLGECNCDIVFIDDLEGYTIRSELKCRNLSKNNYYCRRMMTRRRRV